MKANYVTRKFKLTKELREKISKRLKRFDKFFPDETEVIVTLYEEKDKETIELTIFDKGTFYRAEVTDDDILCATDKAVDIIERQIRKYKTRLEKRLRAGAFDSAEPILESEDPDELKIIRVKKFLYKPMTPEEAILQMQLLGHQFFVFNDVETDEVCVVYKRKNGEYGIIMPTDE